MEHSGLKVVLHVEEGRALVGIQQKDTDPVLEWVQASTLEEALGAVLGLVARAREQGAQSPRNPAYQRPPPPPAAPGTQPQPGARRPTLVTPRGGMTPML